MLPSSPILAGHSSNSRIVWEHTRGRYSCTQCPYASASREEMTLHIEEHRKNPPPPGRLDADMGTTRGVAERTPPPPKTAGILTGSRFDLLCVATRTPLPLSWRRVTGCWAGTGLPRLQRCPGVGVPVPPHWAPAPKQEAGREGLGCGADALFPLPPDFGVGLPSFHTKLSPEMENSLYSQL